MYFFKTKYLTFLFILPFNYFGQISYFNSITNLVIDSEIVFIGENHSNEKVNFIFYKELIFKKIEKYDSVIVFLERPYSESVLLNFFIINKNYDSEILNQYFSTLMIRNYKEEVSFYKEIFKYLKNNNNKTIIIKTYDVEYTEETLAFIEMFFLNNSKINFDEINIKYPIISKLNITNAGYLSSNKKISLYIDAVKKIFNNNDSLLFFNNLNPNIYNEIKYISNCYKPKFKNSTQEVTSFLNERELILSYNINSNLNKTNIRHKIIISGLYHVKSFSNNPIKSPFIKNTNFIENKTFIYFLTNKKYNLKSLSKLFLIESELNKSDNSIIYYVN